MIRQNIELMAGNSVTICYVDADEAMPEEFWGFLASRRYTGFDVESGGPDGLTPTSVGFEVRLVAFAGEHSAWVLHGDRVADIRRALTGNTIFVAHNKLFDTLAVKAAYGVLPARVVDTLALASLVYPPDPGGSVDDDWADEVPLDDRHQLKPLSILTGSRALIDAQEALFERFTELLGPCPPGSEQAAGVKKWLGRGYATLPVNDLAYVAYNGLDALFGLRVMRWLIAEWERRPGHTGGDIRRLLANESRLGEILGGITWRGLRVDRVAMRKVYQDALGEQKKLLPQFEPFGVANPASNKQISEALYALEVIRPITTKDGISTEKKFGLPRLLEADQPDDVRKLAGLLEAWRGHSALKTKIREIDKLLPKSGDGRVHPRVNPLQAKTGRMSISDPALQNLPKNDPRIRSVFLAEPGYVLVSADFAQVEYRVAAALSGDDAMIEVIVSGVSFHEGTAALIFGPAYTDEPEDSPRRKELYGYAKNCGFLSIFGGGASNLAATSGGAIGTSQAQDILDKFWASYPELRAYTKRVQRHQEIVSHSGRRAAVDPDRVYANTNYYVQGTARDVFADALLRLRAAGWSDYLWLVIHDEIILMVPQALAEQAKDALEAAMTTTFFGVPINAEAEIRGDRWMALPELEPVAA